MSAILQFPPLRFAKLQRRAAAQERVNEIALQGYRWGWADAWPFIAVAFVSGFCFALVIVQ